MRVELMFVEKTILQELGDRRMTRDSVATTYAFGLRSSEEIDWARVNGAIVERWSVSALDYIKGRAWKKYLGQKVSAARTLTTTGSGTHRARASQPSMHSPPLCRTIPAVMWIISSIFTLPEEAHASSIRTKNLCTALTQRPFLTLS